MSTSLLREIAERYCEGGDEAMLAKIMVHGGSHVGAFAGAPDLIDERGEREILLPRATFLRVHETDRTGVTPVVNMEVLT